MTLRPVPLTDGAFLDFRVSHNRIVAAGYKYARAEILPVVAFEREQYSRVRSSDALLVRDDAGDNLRIYISQLRAILDDQVTIQQRVLRDVAVNEAQRFDRAWVASIKAGANVDVSLLIRDDDLVDFLSLRAQEHVGLIKSLSDDVAQYIERTALGSILEGRGNRETEKLLSQFEGINRNRARLIARDQASKLNGAMNQFRQEQAGVTHYKWRTVLDGRERQTHHDRNGKTFAWAKPPSDGAPGKAINCRCRASAILIDDEATALESPKPFDAISEALSGDAEWERFISGWRPEMNQSEIDALSGWHGANGADATAYLRGYRTIWQMPPNKTYLTDDGWRSATIADHINSLVSGAMRGRTPFDMLLYRAIESDTFWSLGLRIGESFDNLGLAGTTPDLQAIASRFRDNTVIMRIAAPKGTMAVPGTVWEREITLAHATRFTVRDISTELVQGRQTTVIDVVVDGVSDIYPPVPKFVSDLHKHVTSGGSLSKGVLERIAIDAGASLDDLAREMAAAEDAGWVMMTKSGGYTKGRLLR